MTEPVIKLDDKAKTVYVNDERIKLSPQEFEVFRFLLANKDKVLSFDEIANAVTPPLTNVKKAVPRIFSENQSLSSYLFTVSPEGYVFSFDILNSFIVKTGVTMIFDPQRRRAIWKHERCFLVDRTTRLLSFLSKNQGRIIAPDELSSVFGGSHDSKNKALVSLAYSLEQKADPRSIILRLLNKGYLPRFQIECADVVIEERYLFGDFVFDPENEILLDKGVARKLTPPQSAFLELCCKSNGRIITKEEIIKAMCSFRYASERDHIEMDQYLRRSLGGYFPKDLLVRIPGKGWSFTGGAVCVTPKGEVFPAGMDEVRK